MEKRNAAGFMVRVSHELDFFTVYDNIDAPNYSDAEQIAKEWFTNDFCGGELKTNPETGRKYKLEAFVFDKYKHLK